MDLLSLQSDLCGVHYYLVNSNFFWPALRTTCNYTLVLDSSASHTNMKHAFTSDEVMAMALPPHNTHIPHFWSLERSLGASAKNTVRDSTTAEEELLQLTVLVMRMNNAYCRADSKKNSCGCLRMSEIVCTSQEDIIVSTTGECLLCMP